MWSGFGGLSLSVEGPSKTDIQCDDNADGTCQVKYIPTEPGNYIVNIKFADEHIRGPTASSVKNITQLTALRTVSRNDSAFQR